MLGITHGAIGVEDFGLNSRAKGNLGEALGRNNGGASQNGSGLHCEMDVEELVV